MRWRYRPFQAVAIAALAALVTACATFAPLYDRAMRQALTDITVAQAPAEATGVALVGTPYSPDFDRHISTPPPSPTDVAATLPAEYRQDFDSPVLGYAGSSTVLPTTSTDPVGQMVWRDGACEHVAFLKGSCPTAAGQVAISKADVEHFHLAVGSRVPVAGGKQGSRIRLTVTGVYQQDPSDYWAGFNLTGLAGVPSSDPVPHVQHDIWLTDRATFDAPGQPLVDAASATALYPINQAHVGVDDVLALGPAMDALITASDRDHPGFDFTVATGLPDLAASIQSQIDQSRVTIPLLMAQLGLLAVVVLWLILLLVTEQRRPEVALARLRGRGRRGARGLLLAELAPIVLAGVLPGALLAILVTWLARTLVLAGNAPFELGLPFLAGLALAVVLLAVVTGVAVARVAREPVDALLRRVPPRRAGWAIGVGDAFVMAGAGGVVVVFAAGGLDGPSALVAPGLLAIVVGLVLAHLTTPTAGLLGGRLLRRGRVRAGVSVLDAARSPATRRVVAIVTLASALAVFSADALLVGERNRTSASEQEAGAPLVAEVRGTDLAAVRAALDEVDPGGRTVTPVVRITPPGTGATSTLAVVPDAFRRIALFPGGAPPASTWDAIAVPEAQPIKLTGTTVSLDVDGSTITSRRIDGGSNPVDFGLDLITPAGETLHTTLGELGTKGDHHFTADVSCGDGCYVAGIWTGTLPGATIRGSATLRHLVGTGDGQPDDPVALGPATRWTAFHEQGTGSFVPRSTSPDELGITVHGGGSQLITMVQDWVPSVVPALVEAGNPPPGTGGLTLTSLDGEEHQARSVGTLARVPASGPLVNVVNLDLVQRGSVVSPNARLEIWFADDDPAELAAVTKALHEHDVSLAGSTSLADVRRTYDESAAAWSLQLAALVGAVALLIALLVLVVSAISGWRSRTRDLAALRMSGVSAAAMRSMAVTSQLPPVLIGVLAGAVSGLVGAQLALPIVPLFPTSPEISTLDLDTAWAGVLGAAVLALLVLGLGAVAIGRAMARRAHLRRLRDVVL